jgi:hypothetical protein
MHSQFIFDTIEQFIEHYVIIKSELLLNSEILFECWIEFADGVILWWLWEVVALLLWIVEFVSDASCEAVTILSVMLLILCG